ncbi:hypothetical protein pD_gene0020 [Vibrio phage 033B]|nr:hypothetical protein pD_gene0020 [Vibrio phage 033B]
MKTYKQKSSAVRAAKAALKKEGIADPKAGEHFDVKPCEMHEGEFIWHALGNQTPAETAVTTEEDFEEGNSRREMTFNEAGDPVPVEEAAPFRNIPSHYQAVAPLKNTTVKKMVIQNTSTIASPTKQVWEIADRMRNENPDVRRKDVIQACVDAGIAFNTARTQYQHYFKACKGEY